MYKEFDVRSINKDIDLGQYRGFGVYLNRAIIGSMNFETKRIIRARTRHGVLQVRLLNTGVWVNVDKKLDYISSI